MKTTIDDIAKMAGVSKSTVSRALNGTGYISKDKKKKILELVKLHNYVPDSKAVNLSKKKTMTIGLVLPSVTGPFYGEVIQGVEEVLSENKYFTLFMTFESNSPEKNRERYLSLMSSGRIDGIIIFDPQVDSQTVEKVTKFEIPVVYLGEDVHGSDVILVDNFSGAYSMTEHLIKIHKHERIAFITGPAKSFDSVERLRGYKFALENNDIEFDPSLVCRGDFTKESGKNAVENCLKNGATAIFAANDEMALGVIEELERKRIKVGKEIAVVGFDDTFWSRYIQPPLTTVHQPMHSIGKMAAKTILDRINSKDLVKSPMRIVLSTRLIVRNSCGCETDSTN
ncbi:LacI family DNA-binding transcriptional regulator [Athalassotoga saccharophila]|uniref:LacI family DNA-binding transcriptional regulator n=1 Tax=Athalassotoga saccharophila TaxID=1441386 RepID=UPI001379CB59|nr:LacI family DNA-binding transcriptional regulator [Athalassotoga saccharophila]BBJ28150.1 HTH-type transcriptional regulator DegA [Athalassotoga saccharophila]